MACLDTNVLINLVRGGDGAQQATAKLDSLRARGLVLCTTRFNLAEMYVGAVRSADRAAEEAAIEAVVRRLVILEFDDRAARFFGEITASLQRMGRPAGDMDVLIASTAMADGRLLVTRNPAHFVNIARLQVESY